MATLQNTDLRNGTVFKEGSNIYQVIRFDLKKRGRGSSKVKVKVRDIKTGAITEKTYGGQETVESVELSKSNAQFLYSDEAAIYLMDAQTFEQFSLPKSVVGDSLQYVKEGAKVLVLRLDDKPVTVEVPASVVLKIEYTEPATKGDTSSNAVKDARLETGAKIKVPLFINTGDMVKINTETGQYSSKA